MNSMGYCPNCKKNVSKKRENFSYLLAFLLAFTGIGLVIYILYYIDKKSKFCVYCDTLCEPVRLESNLKEPQKIEFNDSKLLASNKVKFCHNCGTEIDYRSETKFCHLCGNDI
ncbi:MAG TPA: hypothetical protein VGB37_04210 [Candidatus Lokiarchaeia archaeon]